MNETRRLGGRAGEVFRVFLGLGLTSFGGPVAHIGYFRRACVERVGWLTESEYAGWVGLCQFLPGPASTQLAFCIGMVRGGVWGALAAFVAFTLPSALLMAGFAFAISRSGDISGAGWLHGLKLVAVAVVAHGLVGMARRLCTDVPRAGIALAVGAITLTWPLGWVQPACIAGAALAGALVCRSLSPVGIGSDRLPYGTRAGALLLAGFAMIGVVLPLAATGSGGWAEAGAAFCRAGAWVFGGGHVVLPLLEQSLVGPGWISREEFLAGYGAAQAVPGPMFTLAAFLGGRLPGNLGGLGGSLLGTVAIFLPGLLAVAGVLPFWDRAIRHGGLARAIAGVNAGVVGLLGAALLGPVGQSAVKGWVDVAVVGMGLAALLTGRVPVLAVVVGCVLAGMLLTR